MVQAAQFRTQASPREICCGQSNLPATTSVLTCQYHSINAPYAFIGHQTYVILKTISAVKKTPNNVNDVGP
jgi:hypothetical protein